MYRKTPTSRVTFTRSLKLSLLVLVGVFSLLATNLHTPQKAQAATSSYLNFQARLEATSGAIAPDGNYNVEFKLYSASSGGTALWTEDYLNSATQGIRVTNGYLTTNLGSITAFPVTINWDQQVWITMTVRGTGSCAFAACTPADLEMSPRLQLTAVPYAFKAGQLAQANAGGTLFSSLSIQAPTVGNQNFVIQDQGAAGTFNLLTAPSGSDGYIKLQGSTPGTAQTGNFNISGTGIAGTLQAATFDTSSASTLNIGLTASGNATSISLNQSTTVAAGKYIRVIGDITASRPASPTAGMLFYDTTTNQLVQYNGTKWVGAPRTATKIVAANNSTQAEKDAADYVATGTGDQATINSALTALPAGGGSVYLMEGTYYETAAISIPNNTTLAGAGAATLITMVNAQNGTYNIIQNTDTVTGTHVTIRDLQIDGNKANQTSGAMYGIYLNGMGSGNGSTALDGAKLTNLTVRSMKNGTGIYLFGSSNNTITGNTAQGNSEGIFLDGSSNNTITGNTTQGNSSVGIYLFGSSNNTITGNTTQGNSSVGIELDGSSNNTITGNTFQGNGTVGIYFDGSSNNTITGNTFQGNGNYGIYLVTSSNNNNVSSNKVHANGGVTANNGIYLLSSSNNTITSNDITDTSCTTTCYAITVSGSASSANYLASNNYSGTAANAASINDFGTGTIYANQQDSIGNLINKSAGGGFTIGASAATASLTLQGGLVSTVLSVPTLSATVTNVGTAGATTYRYQITALDGTGETTGSTVQQTTTGNATLSGTNYNTITWTPVGGAYQYKIYRCTAAACTPALLTTVAGNTSSYKDQAAGAPSGAVPASNTTGGGMFAGALQATNGTFVGDVTQSGGVFSLTR